jgi:hypothetical protein
MVVAISGLVFFVASSLGALAAVIGLIRKAMIGRWSAAPAGH